MEFIVFKPLEASESLAKAEAFFFEGRYSEAESLFQDLATQPANASTAYLRLGQIARNQNQLTDAANRISQALALVPNWPDALYELAMVLLAANKAQDAIALLEKAILQDENHVAARRSLADLLHTAGHWRSAVEHYAALFTLQPTDPTLFQNFGFCCQELEELDLAEKAYVKTLQLGLDSAELRFNLGIIRMKQSKPREAIADFESALRKDPSLTFANLAIANSYRTLGDLESAELFLRRELEVNPACADASVNLGVVLQEKQRVAEAIECYKQGIRSNPYHPVLHWNLAIASLLAGDFKTGWKEYEWRWQVKRKPKPKFQQPEWNGQDLGGRNILLYAEQGFGDTLMFIRYAPFVARRNGRVILECQPPLKRLLSQIPELSSVISFGEAYPDFDVQAPLMSLPRILGHALDAEYPWEPYLKATPDSRWSLPSQDQRTLKVGLVWGSNPKHPIFVEKSLDLVHWGPIVNAPGCEFFSLQIDLSDSAATFIKAHPQIRCFSQRFGDFADTASVVRQLDLVISVDTAVAHLAGGLGHPVWVLLPFSADWRWLLKRKDSPWYPSMRLFRQPCAGDWATMVTEVARELTTLSLQRSLQVNTVSKIG